MPFTIRIITTLFFISTYCFGQIPALDSDPNNTTKIVYLDFDGQVVSGTLWNSGNTVNALPSGMSASDINQIYKRVCEDYAPFDVCITTILSKFNNAPANTRMRVVITPSSAWYGNSAGGVAYVSSFAWGGTPGTPCWVFEDMLSYSPRYIAEAISHEVGHTLTLRHQSSYIYPAMQSCSKTAEYNPGQGNGVTSWAPIMGVGYYNNVTTWYNGKSTLNCNQTQYDHSNSGTGITSPGFLTFRTDDVGNTSGTAKILNLNAINLADSGRMTQPTDIDAYKFTICNNRYVSIDVKPWALDTNLGNNGYQGANLDVRLFLYNAANNQLAVDSPLTRLNARIGMNLTPGTYWFTVDGGGSANYSDYGSMGRYSIKIKATNPPALTNMILTSTVICPGQPFPLNYASNGVSTQWLWTVNGPTSGTYTTQNPNVIFNQGTYTITLLTSNANTASCPTTTTLTVNPLPAVVVTNNTSAICSGNSLNLNAGGANSYTWSPGGSVGSLFMVAPLSTTNYTVTGSNGNCVNQAVTTVTVSPHFTITASASASSVCAEDITVLNAFGASSYTFNPGNYVASVMAVTQSVTTTYTISGEKPDNACVEDTTITLVMKDCVLGIKPNEWENNNVRIYPNPSHNYLIVETKSNDTTVEIFNSLGQVMLIQKMNGKPIQIMTEQWPRGIYFVTVPSEKTQRAQKIVLH